MAMSRSLGGTALTTRPPMAISPDVMFSRPASMRSKVDLPQPDGPTRTTNSPSAMSTLTPCNTSTGPNAFRTVSISTVAILPPRAAAEAAFYLNLCRFLRPVTRRGLKQTAPQVRAVTEESVTWSLLRSLVEKTRRVQDEQSAISFGGVEI